jgi:hypothetical protein
VLGGGKEGDCLRDLAVTATACTDFLLFTSQADDMLTLAATCSSLGQRPLLILRLAAHPHPQAAAHRLSFSSSRRPFSSSGC